MTLFVLISTLFLSAVIVDLYKWKQYTNHIRCESCFLTYLSSRKLVNILEHFGRISESLLCFLEHIVSSAEATALLIVKIILVKSAVTFTLHWVKWCIKLNSWLEESDGTAIGGALHTEVAQQANEAMIPKKKIKYGQCFLYGISSQLFAAACH